MIENHYDNRKAVIFFNAIMPILQGVVAKLTLARNKALEEYTYLEKIETSKRKNLEELVNMGSNAQGIISRLAGIIGGGSIGAILPTIRNEVNLFLPSVLAGIAIGYGIVEILLHLYKAKMENSIIKETNEEKKRVWDDEFTLVTSTAILRFYKESLDITTQVYNTNDQLRTRDIARDFHNMTELFLQRPVLDGKASHLPQFIQLCAGIEYEMARYITNSELKKEYKKYRSLVQKSTTSERLTLDPFKSGFEGLSGFLSSKNLINGGLRERIMNIREKRVRIIHYADYDYLMESISEAEKVLDGIRHQLKFVKLAVIRIFPIDGSTGVNVSTRIEATFNLPLDKTAINFDSFFLKSSSSDPTIVGDFRLDTDGSTILFSPQSPLSLGQRYVVTIKDVRGSSGEKVAQPMTWSFTT